MPIHRSTLCQVMTVLCRQIKFVCSAHCLYQAQGFFAKRVFALKGMQHYTLQQIPKAYFMVGGYSLQNLKNSLFNSDTRLNSLDGLFCTFHSYVYSVNYRGTMVPR